MAKTSSVEKNNRRAKLVTLTAAGREAISRINPQHATAAAALVHEVGAARLREVLVGMHELSAALDRVEPGASRQGVGPGPGGGELATS